MHKIYSVFTQWWVYAVARDNRRQLLILLSPSLSSQHSDSFPFYPSALPTPFEFIPSPPQKYRCLCAKKYSSCSIIVYIRIRDCVIRLYLPHSKSISDASSLVGPVGGQGRGWGFRTKSSYPFSRYLRHKSKAMVRQLEIYSRAYATHDGEAELQQQCSAAFFEKNCVMLKQNSLKIDSTCCYIA